MWYTVRYPCIEMRKLGEWENPRSEPGFEQTQPGEGLSFPSGSDSGKCSTNYLRVLHQPEALGRSQCRVHSTNRYLCRGELYLGNQRGREGHLAPTQPAQKKCLFPPPPWRRKLPQASDSWRG